MGSRGRRRRRGDSRRRRKGGVEEVESFGRSSNTYGRPFRRCSRLSEKGYSYGRPFETFGRMSWSSDSPVILFDNLLRICGRTSKIHGRPFRTGGRLAESAEPVFGSFGRS